MVRRKRTKKYTTRIGQYTGTSNISKNEHTIAISVARVADSLCGEVSAHVHRDDGGEVAAYQNCHSGRRRTNGRNSSSREEGRGEGSSPPSSISSAGRSSWSEGSKRGWRNARKRLRM